MNLFIERVFFSSCGKSPFKWAWPHGRTSLHIVDVKNKEEFLFQNFKRLDSTWTDNYIIFFEIYSLVFCF